MKAINKKLAIFVILGIVIANMVAFGVFADGEIIEDVIIGGLSYELDTSTMEATFMTVATSAVSTVDYPAALVIPSTVDYDGSTYTVTAMSSKSTSSRFTTVTSITIPDTVTSCTISFKIFSNLETITIPGTMTTFDGNFNACDCLTTVVFEEGVEYITATTLFYSCDLLASVTLPDSLIELNGYQTFAYCKVIEEIDLPENVTLTGSVQYTFAYCYMLKEMILPSSVTEIGDRMFYSCSVFDSLTCLGTITEVGSNSFYGCSSLADISSLGTSVTALGKNAFYKCTSLVDISCLDDSITEIGQAAFQYCDLLETIFDTSNVTSVGSSAFAYCYNLTGDIDLSSATTISSYAFRETAITSVTLSDLLETIYTYTFYNTNITTIDIPDSVTSIGNYAFYGTELITVTIGDGVTSLSTSVFANSASLEEVTIGSGVTNIDSTSFADCTSLSYMLIDNSRDNVSLPTTLGALDSADVLFTVASVGDVGDTISDDIDALTIQEIIDAAGTTPVTIVISKHIQLSSSIVIPDGANVTITTEGDDVYKILGYSSSDLESLIYIEEGGSLTLSGNIEINGNQVSLTNSFRGVIKVEGSLLIEDNVLLTNATLEYNTTAVIYATGENASVIMTGGSIEGIKLDFSSSSLVSSAPVVVNSGASFELDGGTITNNSIIGNPGNYYYYSLGVFVSSGGTFTMTSGEISDNIGGYRGTAVYVMGSSSTNVTYFYMNGGTISGNYSSMYGSYESCGAIYVEDNATFILENGLITNNYVSNGQGGGVTVVSDATFIMYDGIISYNTASSSGGGIYVYSDNVSLYGGLIEYNTADQGGGIYVAGVSTEDYSTLHVYDVLITENTATNSLNESDGMGGGIWLCPTGDITFYVAHGSAIYGNTATGAGDDLVVIDSDVYTHYITLSNRALGGENVSWYQDGDVIDASSYNPTGSVDTTASRYDEEDDADHIGVTISDHSGAYKAIISDEDSTLSADAASLIISNNTAVQGGGIASNGSVVVGDSDTELVDMTVSKEWVNLSDDNEAVEITLTISIGDTVTDTVVLNEENNWATTLTNVLPDQSFTVAELTDGDFEFSYEITVDADGNYKVTATNTYEDDNESSTSKDEDEPEDEDETEEALPDSGNNSHLDFIMLAFVFSAIMVAATSRKLIRL